MYALREVQRGNYDDRGYSNEETIAHLMLSKPSEINSDRKSTRLNSSHP